MSGECHRRLHTEVEAQKDAHRGFFGLYEKSILVSVCMWIFASVCVCVCVLGVCQECSIPPSHSFPLYRSFTQKWLKLKTGVLRSDEGFYVFLGLYFCVCVCASGCAPACFGVFLCMSAFVCQCMCVCYMEGGVSLAENRLT